MMVEPTPPLRDGAPPREGLRARLGRGRRALAANGLDVAALARSARGIAPFLADRRAFLDRAAATGEGPVVRSFPVLGDRFDQAGAARDPYFLQDLLVARMVCAADPDRHVDVGSRLDGFVAHLLVSREVEVVDVRPLDVQVPGLRFVQGDGTTLEGIPDASVESLSSLHAIEHFGLGRYGDPIDPEGSARALGTFARVLAPGGRLYVSVPVGQRRIEFNAHRVFDPDDVPALVPTLRLDLFTGIDDAGGLHEDVAPARLAGERYALGIYVFSRPDHG